MGALLARQCWQGWLRRGELDSFLLPSPRIGAGVCGMA